MPKTGSWIAVVGAASCVVAGIATLSRPPSREVPIQPVSMDAAEAARQRDAQQADYAAWRGEAADYRDGIRREQQEREFGHLASADRGP